jgi:hypothetical protein
MHCLHIFGRTEIQQWKKGVLLYGRKFRIINMEEPILKSSNNKGKMEGTVRGKGGEEGKKKKKKR